MTGVVAVGGGHGAAATLRAARRYASQVVGVVSVADDGGSSGRLRQGLAIPAVGDLRKCVVALADVDRPLVRTLEHRFGGGELAGHSFGNVMIAALVATCGGLVPALAELRRLTGGVGDVLPATEDTVVLVGCTADGRHVRGQVQVMGTAGLVSVGFDPVAPRAPAAAVAAIEAADQVVIGPGSLYTSVLAAVAVPEVRDAVTAARGRVVYVCNLRPQEAETEGYTVADHLAALDRHGVRVDVVLHDPDHLEAGDLGEQAAVAARVADDRGLTHDPERLARALADLS